MNDPESREVGTIHRGPFAIEPDDELGVVLTYRVPASGVCVTGTNPPTPNCEVAIGRLGRVTLPGGEEPCWQDDRPGCRPGVRCEGALSGSPRLARGAGRVPMRGRG